MLTILFSYSLPSVVYIMSYINISNDINSMFPLCIISFSYLIINSIYRTTLYTKQIFISTNALQLSENAISPIKQLHLKCGFRVHYIIQSFYSYVDIWYYLFFPQEQSPLPLQKPPMPEHSPTNHLKILT